jgi:CDGSH-type Zn-finger protein
MRFENLKPCKILTTHDFPVHNEQVLKIYHMICQKGHPEMIPPCPVIHKSIGLPLLDGDGEYNSRIKNYFEEHPEVEYILCDGSHKTTALNLTGNPINVMIIETDEDVKRLREMEESGEIMSFAGPNTIEAILKDMARHHSKTEFFETVEEKTERMVREKAVPGYMIEMYRE